MLNAVTPEKAFALYIKGKSLRDIAHDLGVSKSTTERWSRKYAWVLKRRLAWESVTSDVAQTYAKQTIARELLVADHLFQELTEALQQRRAYMEGRLPRRALKHTVSEICRLAEATIKVGVGESVIYETQVQRRPK